MAGLGRKIFTAGDVLTASDVQNYMMDQTVMNFAGTAARSSAIATPTDGMVSVLSDIDELQYYNGTAWQTGLPFGAWLTWAPTLGNTWANGNGVWDAKYCQIGKTVHVRATFTLGSTTTKGASLPSVTLPVTAASSTLPLITGPAPATVAATAGQLIFPSISTTTTISLYVFNAGGTYLARNNVTSTVPALWATGDVFQIAFTYEAA